jgi:hypothetical protein
MRMPRAFAPQASARERGVAVRRPPSERSPVAVVSIPPWVRPAAGHVPEAGSTCPSSAGPRGTGGPRLHSGDRDGLALRNALRARAR